MVITVIVTVTSFSMANTHIHTHTPVHAIMKNLYPTLHSKKEERELLKDFAKSFQRQRKILLFFPEENSGKATKLPGCLSLLVLL